MVSFSFCGCVRVRAWVHGSLNNSLALTSSKTTHKESDEALPGGSPWRPSVKIHGKLHHYVGPLNPGTGEAKQFAQLYVHDPTVEAADEEFKSRWAALDLGKVSGAEERRMYTLLRDVQAVYHAENAWVQDFVMAAELFEEEGADAASLLISRNERPQDTHARQYDSPSSLFASCLQPASSLEASI